MKTTHGKCTIKEVLEYCILGDYMLNGELSISHIRKIWPEWLIKQIDWPSCVHELNNRRYGIPQLHMMPDGVLQNRYYRGSKVYFEDIPRQSVIVYTSPFVSYMSKKQFNNNYVIQ